MNQLSYHNTTNEPIQLAINFDQKAKQQENEVLKYYQWWKNPASASNVHRYLIIWKYLPSDTPLTSIRRAITNLTKQGKLKKTNIKVKGLYGRDEYCWEKT